jgi:hypothetical protein
VFPTLELVKTDKEIMKKKPINLIVVDADGEIITAANGLVSSDNPELVKTVKRSVFLPWSVQLVSPFGQKIRPSLDPNNLIGITAALYSAKPGRTRLLQAPPEVMEWFKEEHAKRGDSCLTDTRSFGGSNQRTIEDIARELAESVKDKKNQEGQ